MKRIFLTMTAFIMLSANCAEAQVTIGSLDDPQPFSVLELISNTGGLRLPQLDSDQRDALNLGSLSPASQQAALGLQIFNIDNLCVETWNGTEWIKACYNNTPAPAPLSGIAGVCLTNSQTSEDPVRQVYTFTPTYAADPGSLVTPLQYEFFNNGSSVYRGSNNTYTFPSDANIGTVTASLYYPAFTQPAVADQTYSNINSVSGVNLTMKGIQGGTFTMGVSTGEWDAYQSIFGNVDITDSYSDLIRYCDIFGEHSVDVSSFSMSETEITRAQWQSVMGMLTEQYNPEDNSQS
ncbi:MAG: hypothetical protein LBJ17_00735, partial [Dysgonamonadaceae bacterium]|nr:hypothetical protein [Dysgonamonadaceae bacterium]